jgi:hypothetical protein
MAARASKKLDEAKLPFDTARLRSHLAELDAKDAIARREKEARALLAQAKTKGAALVDEGLKAVRDLVDRLRDKAGE